MIETETGSDWDQNWNAGIPSSSNDSTAAPSSDDDMNYQSDLIFIPDMSEEEELLQTESFNDDDENLKNFLFWLIWLSKLYHAIELQWTCLHMGIYMEVAQKAVEMNQIKNNLIKHYEDRYMFESEDWWSSDDGQWELMKIAGKSEGDRVAVS